MLGVWDFGVLGFLSTMHGACSECRYKRFSKLRVALVGVDPHSQDS